MASYIKLSSASLLIGSPIVYAVQASVLSGTVAFHRVNLTVSCAMTGQDTTTALTFSSPADSGEIISFDISSALRACADSYEYTVNPPDAYPSLTFSLSASDEYMQDGEVHEGVDVVTTEGFTTYLGAYTDLERFLAASAGSRPDIPKFTRKPVSPAEVVKVGESMVCPNIDLTAPHSTVVDITTEGLQTINGHQVYALPASAPTRYPIRFVNGLGCLESISVTCLPTKEMNVTSTEYSRSIQEQFSSFSRTLVSKANDYEKWKLSTGPLSPEWHAWFLHEFLMSPTAWILVDSHWLPCHILADETISISDASAANPLELQFTIRFDFNGSPHTSLVI